MKHAVVTGATGHLGNVLVRHLLARGVRVRALVRPSSDVTALQGLDVELVQADVRDRASLDRAFEGGERVFHCAGVVSITAGKEAVLKETNVEGTRHVIEACVAAKVRRLVYTSSVHALTEPKRGGVLDERAGYDPRLAHGAYGKSKAAASRLVEEAAKSGRLDAVLVLPVGVHGPYDFLCSEAGQLVSLAGRGRLPVLIGGGYDWVDVRDVADGTIAAASLGRSGESYLLSRGYLKNVELCRLVAQAAGVRPPLFALPLWLARVFSYGGLLWELVTGRRALLTPYAVHTVAKDFEISGAKARAELGFSPRPLEETLADAWAWLSTDPASPLQRKLTVAPARKALLAQPPR
jgi:dihydroflavonol-4-reductase